MIDLGKEHPYLRELLVLEPAVSSSYESALIFIEEDQSVCFLSNFLFPFGNWHHLSPLVESVDLLLVV